MANCIHDVSYGCSGCLHDEVAALVELLRAINATDAHGYRVAPMNYALRKRIDEALARHAQTQPTPSESELVKVETARLYEQDAGISASEVEFMDELRRRRAQSAPWHPRATDGGA